MHAPPAEPSRRRFTVGEFYHLAEAGILGERDRVELIDGDIVEMTPISARHAGGVNALTAIFTRTLGNRVVAAVQNPVRLDDFSEPQPDFCLLQPRSDLYRQRHPTAEDVLLVVEVACSSQSYDLGVKAPLYARHRVRELWVVDVAGLAVDVYRDPSPDGYRDHQRRVSGESVAPEAFPEMEIAIRDIVGEA